MQLGDNTNQANLPPNVNTHFSWLRTRMSVERTLGSYSRTAVALIGFGFTIVQFFERLNQMSGVAPAKDPTLPRYIGLMLIGIGTLALAIAVWQYQQVLKHLNSESFRSVAGIPGIRRLFPGLGVAVLLCLVGLMTFLIILLRTILH